MVNTGLLSRAPISSLPAPSQGVGPSLLNTGANYSYPITQGLLGSLAQPQGGTDYTAQALALAGNPHAGPYAAVPVPSGLGVPGAPGSSSTSGSNLGSTAVGLLGTLAKNPSTVKGIGNAISNIFGGGAGATSLATLTPADIAASDAASGGALTGADIGAGATDSALSAGAGAGGAAAAGGAATGGLGALTAADIAGSDAAAGGALTGADIGAGATDSALSAGAGAGGAGAGSALAAMGPGAIFGAALLGMNAIFNNQGANPLSVSNAFKQAAANTPNLPLGYTANSPLYRGALQTAGQDYSGIAQQILNGNYAGAVGGRGTNVSGIPFLNKS